MIDVFVILAPFWGCVDHFSIIKGRRCETLRGQHFTPPSFSLRGFVFTVFSPKPGGDTESVLAVLGPRGPMVSPFFGSILEGFEFHFGVELTKRWGILVQLSRHWRGWWAYAKH